MSTITDTVPNAAADKAALNVASAIESVESHLHPTPSWDVVDHPVPNGREEIWRFTPIKRIRGLFADEPRTDALDWSSDLPAGVTMEPISLDEARNLAVEAPVDRVSVLAAKNAAKAFHLKVDANAEITEPVILSGKGIGSAVAEHMVISIGVNAEATIVLHYTGSGSYAEKTDIIVSDGARLNLVTLQDWDDDAIHGGQRSVRVGRDAKVKTITASMGGNLIRLQENAKFAGPGGEVEAYGLYFVDAGQHIQHRLFVDHNEPRTKSNVDYRGALQGKGAHSVWIGDVLIRKEAEGIDTYESNKNLVLTEGCQADSVPNLEIETGEIAGAGHASTTGRFDDEQLFYLQSRGITEAEARRLVVHGFFLDIIRRIGVPQIEDRLMEQVERELELSALIEGSGK